MEKKSNKKLIIILLSIIIFLVGIFCILLATETISFNSNKISDNDTNENVNDDNDETNDNEINIEVSMDNVKVSKDAPNSKIFITGTIDVSYDNNKYQGVFLSGYCLGAGNEKYLIHGPADGRVFFHNDGNKQLTLGENIPQNIEYPDGTTKDWSDIEIDWENVKIKYCKIDKMTAISNDGTSRLETVLNVEKKFE